jgi:hypothetical protein
MSHTQSTWGGGSGPVQADCARVPTQTQQCSTLAPGSSTNTSHAGNMKVVGVTPSALPDTTGGQGDAVATLLHFSHAQPGTNALT